MEMKRWLSLISTLKETIIIIQTMKKVHPLQIINPSISNISTNEVLNNSSTLYCRFCKKIPQNPLEQSELIYPCQCLEPIHKTCISSQLQQKFKSKPKDCNTDKQQRYNCKKCSQIIRFTMKREVVCRNCKEISEYSKENCCFCVGLSISTFIIFLFIAAILILKYDIFAIQNQFVFEATIIGISIACGVMLLIVTYFFVFDVATRSQFKVSEVSKIRQKRNCVNNSSIIIIQNCD